MNYKELAEISQAQIKVLMKTIKTLQVNSDTQLKTIDSLQSNLDTQLKTIDNLQSNSDAQLKTIETLTSNVDSLTNEITQLKDLLLKKDTDAEKLTNKLNGVVKIAFPKKIERRKYVDTSLKSTTPAPTPKERGNNGAKRKVYNNSIEIVDEVEPDHPEFTANKENAKYLFSRDVIRYEYKPSQLIKHIFRCKKYLLNDIMYEAKAPITPLLGSNYDSSVMAFLMQYRFVYGMPIERIVRLCEEQGMDINKQTAHGLVQKGAEILDTLSPVLRDAILKESYINFDESFYTILDKQKKRGSFKGCIWVALASRIGLINYFVDNEASKKKETFITYVPSNYSGAIQTDGNSTYKALDGWGYRKAIRLGCIQHCKRNFIDIGDQRDANEIIDIYNEFYIIRRDKPKDRWIKESQKVFTKLKERLQELEKRLNELPNSLFTKAIAYAINELPSIENIINSTEYKLDNNDIERPMRYISISRRNSMFCGSVAGAKRMALIYSLAVSCRFNNVNSFEYFKDILNKLAAMPIKPSKEQLREILPDKWAANE